MKKIILFSLAIATFTQLSAQKVGGGIEGGMSYSWLATDSKKATTDGGRLGFVYGLFMDINLTDNFAFSTGVNVIENGGVLKYSQMIKLQTNDGLYQLDSTATVFYKLRYLELPLSIKGKTKEIGYITYFGKAGLSPMISIRSRADVSDTEVKNIDNNNAIVDDLENLNIKDEINIFNFGLHLGAGIEYSLGGSTAVIVEVQFHNNFLDMTKDNSEQNNTSSITSSLLQLKAGIKF